MVDTLQAVVWDFDGTLVDTEPLWARTELAMLAEKGVKWQPEKMKRLVGQHALQTAAQMAEAIGRVQDAEKIYDELHLRIANQLKSSSLPFLPGAKELLNEITEAGLGCCLVTASSRSIIDAVVKQLPDAFDFVITSDDVQRPKPDPEAYLQAFNRLGVSPDALIVLEDSSPGIQAALSAGAPVYGVPTFATPEPRKRLHLSTDGLVTTDLARLITVWHELREQR